MLYSAWDGIVAKFLASTGDDSKKVEKLFISHYSVTMLILLGWPKSIFSMIYGASWNVCKNAIMTRKHHGKGKKLISETTMYTNISNSSYEFSLGETDRSESNSSFPPNLIL